MRRAVVSWVAPARAAQGATHRLRSRLAHCSKSDCSKSDCSKSDCSKSAIGAAQVMGFAFAQPILRWAPDPFSGARP
jgi:hypothetical protein